MPPLVLAFASRVTHSCAPVPSVLHLSMAPSPPNDVVTAASAGCSQHPGGRPSAQCSCVPRGNSNPPSAPFWICYRPPVKLFFAEVDLEQIRLANWSHAYAKAYC